jgi:D-alanyl-D-alanine carboxypeptidase/D-alanyl-D-alanine-endopeptidase (penicillin-binding protein 4)
MPVRSRFFAWIPAVALLIGIPAGAADPAPAPATQVATVPAPSGSLEALLAPITEDRLFTVSKIGLQVVSVRTGEEVFARNADLPMIPASTMKVLTAATALRTLGPAWRFATDLYVDEDVEPDAEGIIDGNLYVQGHGDPTLVVETMWRLVHDLKMQGITKIDGNIVYDEGYFDTNYGLVGWDKPEDVEDGPSYFASLGALSLNYNTVDIVVGPGSAVGKPARAELDTPCGKYVELDNQVTTTAEGTRQSVRIEREIVPEDKHMKFTLTGTMPADGNVDHSYRTVADPTALFMGSFAEMLKSEGIVVTGRHVRGTAPADGELVVEHRSEELTEILMDMNKTSNNFMAETVLRTIGAETGGLPGTNNKGIKAVADYLTSLGIDSADYRLVNGSGLSRDARIRPSVFDAVLLDMAHDNRVGHEFEVSLAIAGRDGTLWRRLSEDPGRLRGKTGTIDGVHCLVGYVEASDGEIYAFSFLVNDIHGDSSQVKRLHDRFARRLFTAGMNGPEVVEGGADENPDE